MRCTPIAAVVAGILVTSAAVAQPASNLPLAGFDGSCAAMAQELGARHTVAVVGLCGHNARCMYTDGSALRLLFPAENRR